MILAEQEVGPLIQFTLAPLIDDHGIALAVMGILVVFMALVLVTTCITLLPRLLAQFSENAPDPSRVSPTTVDDEIPEEILVVIAAAVAEVVGKPHRIVKVRGWTPEDLGWSLEGRMQLHQSHRIQQRVRR